MPKRDDAHMAARRRQILDAVRRCVDEKGIAGMSMEDICKAAGMSIGAIYTHFQSKEAILTALVESDHADRPLFGSCRTAAETLRRFGEMLSEFAQREDNSLRARIALEVAGLARRNPKMMVAIEAGYRGQRQTVLEQATRLAHDGLDKTRVAVIGECLFALILSAQLQMLVGVSPDTEAKLRAVRSLIEELHGGPVRLRH